MSSYDRLQCQRGNATQVRGANNAHTVRNELIAGSLSGIAGVASGHPFDLLKVRVQASASTARAPSIYGALRRIVQQEGVGGLFKGLGPPVASQAFLNAVTFGTFEHSLRSLCPGRHRSDAPLAPLFFAGFIAGFVQSFVLSPFELVKCRLQVQDGQGGKAARYSGGVDCVRSLVREGGVTAMGRGLPATLLREAPSFGIYFSSYELFIRTSRPLWGGYVHNHPHIPPAQRPAPPMLISIFAGGLAGSASWLSTYPFDVVKSRVQLSDNPEMTLLRVARTIVKEEGVSVLFRGASITVMRAFPANGVIFTTYELIQKRLNAADAC